jgi:hypothetical protein
MVMVVDSARFLAEVILLLWKGSVRHRGASAGVAPYGTFLLTDGRSSFRPSALLNVACWFIPLRSKRFQNKLALTG